MEEMTRPTGGERGTSLIEVLVTLVIVAIGLLSLAGLHSRLQISELESYQRAQALVLLKDMASRIGTNRAAAGTYITGTPLGTGMTCPSTSATRQQLDAGQWCRALQGAAERAGTTNASVGAMVGARGCVESVGADEYLVTVAWQGMAPISAPPASVTCGAGAYNGASAGCTDDRCRRVVTTLVRIGTLNSP